MDSICALVSKYLDCWYASNTNWFCSIASLTCSLSSCSSLIELMMFNQSVSDLKLSTCWQNNWRLLLSRSHDLYLNLHLCRQNSSKINSLHESAQFWFLSDSILESFSFKTRKVNLLCNSCFDSSLLLSFGVLNQLKTILELIGIIKIIIMLILIYIINVLAKTNSMIKVLNPLI